MKPIYRLEVWIFLQNLQDAPSNSVIFSSLFICAAVSNGPWRVKFCENDIWNYLRNRPNSTKSNYDRLPPLTHFQCWIVRQFFAKSEQFSTRVISESRWPPIFFLAFLTQLTHFLTAVKTKKISRLKNLARTSLKSAVCSEHYPGGI